MRLLASILLVLGACDTVFDLERLPDADVPSTCPASYTKLATGYYRIESSGPGFLETEQRCLNDTLPGAGHTHLAVLSDQAEIDTVYAYARSVQVPITFIWWIGLSNRKAPSTAVTSFRWITDEPKPVPLSRPPWGSIEPNDGLDENCVGLHVPTGTLHDYTCDIPNAFICECDAYAENPNNF